MLQALVMTNFMGLNSRFDSSYFRFDLSSSHYFDVRFGRRFSHCLGSDYCQVSFAY